MPNPTIRTLGERSGDTPGFVREDELGGGSGAIDSVTAGSNKVTVSPTTGDVVVDVAPANFTGIPQAGVTNLVSDLAGKAASSHTHAQSDVTNLVSDLAAKVPTTRTVSTTAPLTGGGALSSNQTIGLSLQTDGLTVTGAGTVASPLMVVGGGAAGAVGGGVWAKPITAHALDDEFDTGTSIAAAWSPSSPSVGALSATAIDPYAGFTTGGTRWSHNERRLNWLMLQPESGGSLVLTKDISSLPANYAVWVHGCFNHRTTNAANNDYTFGIALSGASYDANNRVNIYLNESDASAIQLEFSSIVAGAVVTNLVSANIGPTTHTPFEGMLVQKIGTTYHGWAITNNGSLLYLGSLTYAPTVATVSIIAGNAASTTPGNMIVGIDFIRFVNGSTFLP